MQSFELFLLEFSLATFTDKRLQ